MTYHFNYKCFTATVLIFLLEILIATKLKNIFFVRAYLGDVIVVILLYTFIKSFFSIKNNQKLILGILIFSFLVELAQYFNIAEKSGFQPGSLMYIVIGNSFSWIDIMCYTVGCLILWIFVKMTESKKMIN